MQWFLGVLRNVRRCGQECGNCGLNADRASQRSDDGKLKMESLQRALSERAPKFRVFELRTSHVLSYILVSAIVEFMRAKRFGSNHAKTSSASGDE